MHKLPSTLTRYSFVLALLSFFVSMPASAHHSYAIYDIDNKIERVGVLKEFNWIQLDSTAYHYGG